MCYYCLHSWSMKHLIYLLVLLWSHVSSTTPCHVLGDHILFMFWFTVSNYNSITVKVILDIVWALDQDLHFAFACLCVLSVPESAYRPIRHWVTFSLFDARFPITEKLFPNFSHQTSPPPSGGRTLSFHAAVYTRAPLIQTSICFLRPRPRIPWGKINILKLHRHK